jgi:hypothetical protein
LDRHRSERCKSSTRDSVLCKRAPLIGAAMPTTAPDVDVPSPILKRWVTGLELSLRHHAGVLAIAVIFIVVAIAIGLMLDMPTRSSLWAYLPTYMVLMPMSVATLIIGYSAYIVFWVRPARPLSECVRRFRERFFTIERITMALPLVIVIPIFGGAFTLLKAAIPRINPYSWDPAFATLDRTIHFGATPWELLQSILGYPEITWAIAWIYSSWFFALALVWTWQAFSLGDPRLRLRFFYSLLLIWILFGTVAATGFASGGPCFYGGLVAGPNPFEAMLNYLQAVNAERPINVVWAQSMLWDSYLNRNVQLGGGISAMPSIHVAMAMLFALVGWASNRWIGWITTVYLLAILVGSVHLGWHYAIDGYVMIPGVLVVWWLAGKMAAAGRNPRFLLDSKRGDVRVQGGNDSF